MSYPKLARCIGCAAALLSASVGVHAQLRPSYQFPPAPSRDGPATLQIGTSPFYIAPFANFGVGRDDNVLLTEDNEVRSTVYLFSPGFNIDARGENQVIQIGYQAQAARYAQSRDDDFVDHTLNSQYDVAFDRRNFLRVGLDYVRGHEARGTTDRGIGPEPDRFRIVSPNATYAFGAPGAIGRVELYYTGADRRYLNNRSITAAFDRRTHEGGGALFWRVGQKTYLVGELRQTDFSYKRDSGLDSRERRYFAGVSWDASALLSGTLKVGRLEKKLDIDVPEFSTTAWEVTATWAPKTYSKVDFFAARTANESTGLGNFIISNMMGASWAHAWNSRLSTTLTARFSKDDYEGFDRSDDVTSLGLRVDYRLRRWLSIGAEYTHTQRDSNRPTLDYDKNLYFISATATM